MYPKKGTRVRKIEVPTDRVPEFELGDTAADVQPRMEYRVARGVEGGKRKGKAYKDRQK